MHIYFDIETIPGQAEWIQADVFEQIQKEIDSLKPPGNYKKEESIKAWLSNEAAKLREQGDERFRRCALDGGRGEIVSIAWAVDDGMTQCIARSPLENEVSEQEFIADFFSRLPQDNTKGSGGSIWVGHNLAAFDLPFLWHRCVCLGIKPPGHVPFGEKPWSERIYDTMTQWAGQKGRISQDNLCKILGLPGKPEGMDGSQVYRYWLGGDMDLIKDYNVSDVESVRQIHRRMTFQGAT